jgi:aromatic-L-amino-acid decarboxylase
MPRAQGAHLTDNFKLSTQWSRRMNSLKLWLTLRVHGRQAYEEHIARQLVLAHAFEERMQRSKFYEMAAPVKLPILNLRLKNRKSEAAIEKAQAAIVDDVTRDGRRWISLTRVRGRSVIRFMIISYLTEERHLDELWLALERAADKTQ